MSGRTRSSLLAPVLAVALLVGSACATESDAPSPGPGATEDAETTSTPTTTSTTSPEEALAAGICPAVPEPAPPDPDRPVYRASLDVDPAVGRVSGSLEITFVPDLPIDRVVLRLWPNAPRAAAAGVRLSVSDVHLDGEPVVAGQPDPTILVLPVEEEVEAGSRLELAMEVDLHVPGPVRDRVSRSGDSLRLGSFLPLLPWEPGHGWAEDPPTSLFAEATMSPTADFEVTLDVPEGIEVLASGVPVGASTWRAEAVRDFGASIGRFVTASSVVDAPEPVEVTVGVEATVGEDPADYLERVEASLRSFAERFGPYPWPALTFAVTPGLDGGIEMPAHIIQGPGTQGRTTPHEVAHQWFYGLVGNNQARDPWLDEGLASYAEATFEGSLEEMRALGVPPAGQGNLGAPLTWWEEHRDAYYRSVYAQGAVAVADLGPLEMVDCALTHYVAANAHAIARPEDLVEAFGFVLPGAHDALAAVGIPPG